MKFKWNCGNLETAVNRVKENPCDPVIYVEHANKIGCESLSILEARAVIKSLEAMISAAENIEKAV